MSITLVVTRSCALAALGLALSLAWAPPAAAQPMVHPQPAATDSALDLGWLERTVLERNASLAAMRAAWREAEARGAREGALGDPMLDVAIAPRSFAAGGADPAWRVGLAQPLPLFGQRGLMRQAGASEAEQARQDWETARLDLLQEARTVYYDDYHAERRRDTALEVVELMKQVRRVALARYAAGKAEQSEVLQADVEIAMLDHDAVMADREHRVAMARLAALLHLDSPDGLPPAPRTLALPDSAALERRLAAWSAASWPELAAADARLSAAHARLALARRERLPVPTVGLAYDRFMMERDWRPMVTLSLNLPLDGSRLATAEREAGAAVSGAEAARDAARDRARLRLTQARLEFEESYHELGILRDELVPAAERARASLEAGYEAGRADFAALIDATRALLRARLDLHRSLATVNLAATDLDRALGGPPLAPEKEDRP